MPSPSPPGKPKWTILGILDWTTAYFQRHHIESPRASAEILLAHILDVQRIDLYLRYDQPLTDDELSDYKTVIKRRIQHEPVAYITGQKEFWSMPFWVTPDVLIPRPETECLIETAAAVITAVRKARPLRILDLGTGSGAIALALAAQFPRHRYVAVDISKTAIGVAAHNALKLNVEHRVDFVVCDWLAAFRADKKRFDLIVSNPPYVAPDDLSQLQPEIRDYEPRIALDGDTDGLGCLRRIIRDAPGFIKPRGYVILEIGHDQRSEVEDFAIQTGHYRQVEVFQDYGGHDRVVRLISKR